MNFAGTVLKIYQISPMNTIKWSLILYYHTFVYNTCIMYFKTEHVKLIYTFYIYPQTSL
jgi:hypothetical protein